MIFIILGFFASLHAEIHACAMIRPIVKSVLILMGKIVGEARGEFKGNRYGATGVLTALLLTCASDCSLMDHLSHGIKI